MTEIIACYKFYTREGKRLSIYGKYLNETEIELFILPCSLDEQFNIHTARQYYKDYHTADITPKSAIIVKLQLKPEQTCMNALMSYGTNNYFLSAYKVNLNLTKTLVPASTAHKYRKYAKK